MLENSGKKIKVWATVVLVLGILISIIWGLMIISSPGYGATNASLSILLGLAVIVGGTLISWISSMMVYAFGEIAESAVSLNRNVNTFVTDSLARHNELVALLKAAGQPAKAAEAPVESPAVPVGVPSANRQQIEVDQAQPEVTCPLCGKVQRSDRHVCLGCGAKFVSSSEVINQNQKAAPVQNHQGEHVTVSRVTLSLTCPLCGEHQPSNNQSCQKCGAIFDDPQD